MPELNNVRGLSQYFVDEKIMERVPGCDTKKGNNYFWRMKCGTGNTALFGVTVFMSSSNVSTSFIGMSHCALPTTFSLGPTYVQHNVHQTTQWTRPTLNLDCRTSVTETILDIINRHVSKQSTIINDCRCGYTEGWKHVTVNH